MTNLPRLIGLAGPARSGKSTAADYLVVDRGYTKIAFADAVRECARALNPILGFDLARQRYMRWVDLENFEGYEAAKDNPIYGDEFRGTLQRIGTEMGRETLNSEIWVNTLLDRLPARGGYFVIPDVRFPNEAAAITERGGVVWKVERDRVGSYREGLHISETALNDWEFDATLRNHRPYGLDNLHREIETALRLSSGPRTMLRGGRP